jgi:cyclophilin family peptidyl-prolyl cis-trans isomerase
MPTIPSARAAAIACVLAFAALALAACGGGDGDDSSATPLPEGCQEAQEPAPKDVSLKRPRLKVDRSQRLVATVDTSCGRFEIALDPADSPRTVSSFAYLARKGVYDNTTFHRIVPNFVIQGGDPLGTGMGGPGYFVDEPPPSDAEYTKGTVAMVKTAAEPPGRSGSQFFVVVAADAGLPPQYAVLGKVSSGRGVIERIAGLGDPASGQTGTPLATVVIRKITVAAE